MSRNRYFILTIISIVLLLSSCQPARKVERRGGYLFVKNIIKYDNQSLVSDELEGFMQQMPMNGRLAPYIRPGAWFYDQSIKGKKNGFKKFIRKNLGTPPVILDTNLTNRSLENLNVYLVNKGFYHGTITKSIVYRKKTASVTFHIKAGQPRIVNKLTYNIPDSAMRSYILADTAPGLLHTGMNYDTYALDDERERIAGNLRNYGFYDFSLSDVFYIVDTSGYGRDAAVEVNVKKLRFKPDPEKDSIYEIDHPQYFIRNIFVFPETDVRSDGEPAPDTISYSYKKQKSDQQQYALNVISSGKPWIKPAVLASVMKITPGSLYDQQSANATYKRLIAMPVIRSANITMVVVNPDSLFTKSRKWLDCNIRMIRNQANTLSLGTEGTNTGGRLGMGVNTTFQNRNLFHGGEVFSLKLKTSAEIQANLASKSAGNLFLAFNTLEGGLEGSVDFPRILLPYRPQYLQSVSQAHTWLSAGAGFEYRPDYRRSITTASWSYKWDASEKEKHTFTPLELNVVRITHISGDFQNYLDSLTDPQFKAQYTNHLLTMVRYSYTNSNISDTRLLKQYYLRLGLETSGNSLNIYDHISDHELSPEGYYEHFGIRYAQFARADFDFRRYWKLRPGSSLVMRLAAGVAVPYGNSDVVPFEKSFWLGGANDMRGWRLRSLGPGKYASPSVRYDQAGDIMLQASLEQRFPIYSFLLGGVFVDAGNVWLMHKSVDFPGGEFALNSFADQIAMDAGIGLRLDLSFFVLRIDWALPVRNPALDDKWFNSQDFRLPNTAWNFGIGYPF